MNDLNAPLGQTGRRAATAKRRAARSPKARPGFPLVTALVITGVAGLNVFSFLQRDTLPDSAPIVIAAAAPDVADARTTGSVASADTASANDTGVEVVYGEPREMPASGGDTATAIPEPRPDIPEGRLSEGGPKVIVIRDPGDAAVGQPVQVAHLPDDGAVEDSEWGALPVRTSDGRRPMDIYARPWSQAGGKRIAIVIGGLGLSQTGTLHALEKLPPEITLAFSPQGNSLGRWMREARRQGHELLVQVPMEPFGYPDTDPGPHTLTVNADRQDNLDNLRWALGQITNYTGIVNYLGGRLATADAAMTPVLREVGERGLLYFNDGTGGGEKLGMLAAALDVPYVAANATLDATRDPAAIKAKLAELEKIAEVTGYAIGSGSALEVTVDTVASWANAAKKRGFEIVGVSALAR
ncbi:divergent polysaccharide deacetylase family protein [Oricola indica]|jgi:polysaccharide deacetylase 2 family uncharacterized protein YibQ|uniref:divergent polysaccharide deacetylase family protein n=1 Tax=Oricola indica TaxID=2872591 RepID=UPI001CBDD9F7|nr:divergent polysaccharide deacetylase family protein [Oricola indica]